MSKLNITILVIALVGVVVSSVMLLKSVVEYRNAEEEYSGISTSYVSENTTEETAQQETEEKTEEVQKDTQTGGISNMISEAGNAPAEEEKKELKRNYNRSDYPNITVDFEGLKAINPDLVCWIYLGGADINYPVVQGEDNEFYLHNTFEMKKNSAGCVFMDYEVDPELSSWNTFIYGHNMKNGTMFGHLKNYINNPKTYDNDKYIYIFRPEGIYRYEIFSYYLDPTDSKMYYTCDNYKEYRAYLREATNKSVRECEAKANPEENIVTLVTCSGAGSYKQRFFVHGIFVDRYLYYNR